MAEVGQVVYYHNDRGTFEAQVTYKFPPPEPPTVDPEKCSLWFGGYRVANAYFVNAVKGTGDGQYSET